MAIIVFLAGGFVGLLAAVVSMLAFDLAIGPAFAIYLSIGIALPFYILVQMNTQRRRQMQVSRVEA